MKHKRVIIHRHSNSITTYLISLIFFIFILLSHHTTYHVSFFYLFLSHLSFFLHTVLHKYNGCRVKAKATFDPEKRPHGTSEVPTISVAPVTYICNTRAVFFSLLQVPLFFLFDSRGDRSDPMQCLNAFNE